MVVAKRLEATRQDFKAAIGMASRTCCEVMFERASGS